MAAPKPVDPEIRKRVDELLGHIVSFTGDDEREHWHVGTDIATISDNQLFKPIGYRSLNQFMKSELPGHGRSQLLLYASVARAFSLETTDKHGVTKLGKLLALAGTLDLAKLPDPPDDFEVQLPGENGAVLTKRVADCTAADLQRAIRAARGDSEPAYSPEVNELVARVRALIDANAGESNTIAIKVRVRDGKPFFTLGEIPGELLDEVGRALSQL